MRAILKNPLFLSLIYVSFGQSNSRNSTKNIVQNGIWKTYKREEYTKTIKTYRENEKVYNTGFCVKSDNCNDEGMQDGWDNTVENVFKEMEDYSKCKDCEKRQKDFIELTPNEEELEIQKMDHERIQGVEEKDILPHECPKRSYEKCGCGYPICVLIDSRPVRFESLQHFSKHLRRHELSFRMYHIQKGDCAHAIQGKGLRWKWGKVETDCSSSCGPAMCVIDKKEKIAIPFDSACEAVNYLSDKVDTVTIFAGIGSKNYNYGKDVCYDMIKNKNTYLSTEFFDLDEPCMYGDVESVRQIIKYVKKYKKSSSFKFCQHQMRKSESIVETLTGHSLEMAKSKWGQSTEKSIEKLGGSHICINRHQQKIPPHPEKWYNRKIKCIDYKIKFKCKCLFGCKNPEKVLKVKGSYSKELYGYRARIEKTKTLFDECDWQSFVSIDNPGRWDANIRSTMVWGSKGRLAGDKLKMFKEHACGAGRYDAQYIDSRTIKDNVPCGETGQLITKNTPAFGFLCMNDNQDDNKKNEAGRKKRCNNYKTRFCCIKVRPSTYGPWSSWSSCNYEAKDDVGYCTKEKGKKKYRKRKCLNDSPKTPCTTGPNNPTKKEDDCRPCNPPSEKICKLNEWSQWSRCSISCSMGDVGTRYRTRTKKDVSTSCPGPFIALRPIRKPNPLYRQSETCEVQPCKYCALTEWSKFTECSTSCGQGTRSKKRKCVDASTIKDPSEKELTMDNCDVGDCQPDDCNGVKEVTTACTVKANCPIDGGWAAWGQWSSCSPMCGPSKKKRFRGCHDPMPQHGGKNCPGQTPDMPNQEEVIECKDNPPCPEPCIWGKWGQWSECSKKCWKDVEDKNGGWRTRERKVLRRSTGGMKCDECNDGHHGEPCEPKFKCSEPCKWGEWENKRSCDICKEVGKEPWPYARKERSLIDNFIYHGREAFWNGTAEKRGNGPECFSHDHKINYAATKKSWYKFKEDPEEVVKEPCPTDIKYCKDAKTHWGSWSQWGVCDGDCHNPQYRTRYRKCEVVVTDGKGPEIDREKLCDDFLEAAKKSGNVIKGDRNEESAACGNFCASLEWSPWSEWGPCDATCGKGRKLRTRESGLQGSELTILCSGIFKDDPKYKDICEKGKERDAGDCYTSPCSSKMERYNE